MVLVCLNSNAIRRDFGLPEHLRYVQQLVQSLYSMLLSVVIAREAGDYTVATSMTPPERCKVYE